MQIDPMVSGFLSIFALITFFIFLTITKYSYKLNNKKLLDKDFSKPQSFHKVAVYRSGGVAIFISLIILLFIYYLIFSKILYEYFFVSISLFFTGYIDDIKIKISPNARLLLMSLLLIILVNFIPITIKNIDLTFLNFLLENKFFETFFVVMCFLLIINGSNLVDGFNGLLAINLIVINSILLFINLKNNQFEFSILLAGQIIILITFLLFNFPKAKIFLGDSGSYLMGSLIALNSIITNNLNPDISSFFFCIILFYLFFEVLFSFFRKIYQKKPPFFPDNMHLHMLSYRAIYNFFGSQKSNYINSIVINIVHIIVITPSIFFTTNTIGCRYWFIFQILIYMLIYLRLYRLTKN